MCVNRPSMRRSSLWWVSLQQSVTLEVDLLMSGQLWHHLGRYVLEHRIPITHRRIIIIVICLWWYHCLIITRLRFWIYWVYLCSNPCIGKSLTQWGCWRVGFKLRKHKIWFFLDDTIGQNNYMYIQHIDNKYLSASNFVVFTASCWKPILKYANFNSYLHVLEWRENQVSEMKTQ